MAYLSVDGENKVPCTAAVHRHMGLFHTSALQAYLKQGSSTTHLGSKYYHTGSYLRLASHVEEDTFMEPLEVYFPAAVTSGLSALLKFNISSYLASSFHLAVGIPNLDPQGPRGVPCPSWPCLNSCPGTYPWTLLRCS